MPASVLEKLCLLVTTAVTSAWCACTAAQPVTTPLAVAAPSPSLVPSNGSAAAIATIIVAVVILDAWLVLRGVARTRRNNQPAPGGS